MTSAWEWMRRVVARLLFLSSLTSGITEDIAGRQHYDGVYNSCLSLGRALLEYKSEVPEGQEPSREER